AAAPPASPHHPLQTPQESLRTVQRGGRSTTVFSNSDLAPPSSIPIQPIRRIRSSWSETLRLSVFPHSSKERIPVISYVSCVVIALPMAARAMSDLLQLGSCPVGLP
ncbi:Os04g0126900, partial [Oryza sativa Japonica Group]